MSETKTATAAELEARIRGALVEFGAEESQISAESTWEELDVDSLDLVELAQVIEEEYGVELREQDMFEMKTVGDAVKLVIKELPSA